MKKIIFNNWVKIAEIIVVFWAIRGMYNMLTMDIVQLTKNASKNALWNLSLQSNLNLPLVIVLFYFLSAVLILYLLRKYERKN